MGKSKYPITPLSFEGVSTYPLSERNSKVDINLFGEPAEDGDDIADFVRKLPKILAGKNLQSLLEALLEARSSGRAIIWGLGGHAVKCGLNPILIDMMRNGFIGGLAMNGAAAIHDFEVALKGSTSEEVEKEIGSGRFGMAEETGQYMNAAVNEGVADGIGLGESLGRFINTKNGSVNFQHRNQSLLNVAYEASIPITIHLAIGTDITHIHPSASGENMGQGTMRDFKLLCSLARDLHNGGVYVNLGSAVILPEVFLKVVSVLRNLGHPLTNFTTANLDFIQHYRPTQNVLLRPTQDGGRAIALTGHHEIMLPLIAAALKLSNHQK